MLLSKRFSSVRLSRIVVLQDDWVWQTSLISTSNQFVGEPVLNTIPPPCSAKLAGWNGHVFGWGREAGHRYSQYPYASVRSPFANASWICTSSQMGCAPHLNEAVHGSLEFWGHRAGSQACGSCWGWKWCRTLSMPWIHWVCVQKAKWRAGHHASLLTY